MTTFSGVVSYPTPPYSNPPINPQYYIPSLFFISDISNGVMTTVTTTLNHNYVVGQYVRLLIPRANISIEFNEQLGLVLSIPAPNQVVLDINSTLYNIFQTSTQPNQPQIVATGDLNSGATNASGNVNEGTFIPGSFINISPL